MIQTRSEKSRFHLLGRVTIGIIGGLITALLAVLALPFLSSLPDLDGMIGVATISILLALLGALGSYVYFDRRSRYFANTPSGPEHTQKQGEQRTSSPACEIVEHTARQSAQLKTLLDHVPSSFVLLDRERRIQAVSATFEVVTGRKLTDLIGKRCSTNLWSDRICRECPTQRALETLSPQKDIVPARQPDGSTRYYEHTAIPVMREGELDSVLEMITDITDSKLLQTQMIRAEKLAVTGEMAAVIAHEMRNSLTSVQMILQLLMEGEDKDSTDDASIRVALDSLRRSEVVVSQLLQFARPAPIHPERCQAADLVKESIRLLEHQLERRRIQIKTDYSPEGLELWGDKEQLKTALVNIFLNASQAVGEGGQIKVRCRRDTLSTSLRDVFAEDTKGTKLHNGAWRANKVEVQQGSYRTLFLSAGESVVAISIDDDGPGIPEDRLDRIFDPFFTTKVDGTGLGLPLVKLIVNDNGGVVTVDNLNPGSRFTLILPDRTHREQHE